MLGLTDLPSLTSLTIPHLSTPSLNNVTWLPSPLAIGATGTGLVIAGILLAVFLRAVRIGVYLGAAGALCLFASAVAFGYEKMGEDKIIPQLAAANAKLEQAYQRAAQFQADAKAAQARATQAVRDRAKALAELKQTLEERINAQPDDVRGVVVDPVVVRDLNAAISSFNSTAPVARAVDGAAASASAAGAITVEAWERWSGQAIDLYGQCVSQVRGLQDAYNGLVASSHQNDQLR